MLMVCVALLLMVPALALEHKPRHTAALTPPSPTPPDIQPILRSAATGAATGVGAGVGVHYAVSLARHMINGHKLPQIPINYKSWGVVAPVVLGGAVGGGFGASNGPEAGVIAGAVGGVVVGLMSGSGMSMRTTCETDRSKKPEEVFIDYYKGEEQFFRDGGPYHSFRTAYWEDHCIGIKWGKAILKGFAQFSGPAPGKTICANQKECTADECCVEDKLYKQQAIRNAKAQPEHHAHAKFFEGEDTVEVKPPLNQILLDGPVAGAKKAVASAKKGTNYVNDNMKMEKFREMFEKKEMLKKKNKH